MGQIALFERTVVGSWVGDLEIDAHSYILHHRCCDTKYPVPQTLVVESIGVVHTRFGTFGIDLYLAIGNTKVDGRSHGIVSCGD